MSLKTPYVYFYDTRYEEVLTVDPEDSEGLGDLRSDPNRYREVVLTVVLGRVGEASGA